MCTNCIRTFSKTINSSHLGGREMLTEQQFFEKYNVNESQKKAIEETEGYIRLSAGAGSGKTLTLAARFVYLTDYFDILPDNILCVTFTAKAAKEMQKRIRKMSSTGAEGSLVKTYHGFCVEVLKRDNTRLHFNTDFEIIDEEMMEKLFRDYYKKYGFTLKSGELKNLKFYLGSFKNNNNSYYIKAMTGMNSSSDKEILRDFEKKILDYLIGKLGLSIEVANVAATVLSEYMLHQVRKGDLDFYDLLNFTLYLFEHDDVVRSYWQERLQYIMVDEFQDSSEKELKLLEYLQAKHTNLFIVGDSDQAIYGFKGGDVNLFLDFPDKFQPCTDLLLEENYRSTEEIVNLSNDLIKNNAFRVDKVSKAMNGNGDKVMHFHCKKDKEEMKFIADEIKRLVESREYNYKDIALLVRSHNSKKPIESIFVLEDIPYTIADGTKYYSRKEIRTAIAYLKMILKDDNDAFDITVNQPARGIGESRVNRIISYANEHLCSHFEALKQLQDEPNFKNTKVHQYIRAVEYVRHHARKGAKVSTLLDEILRMSGYYDELRMGVNKERLENVDQLITSVVETENRKEEEYTLIEYIDKANEFMRKAEDDEEKDEVKVMTIHSSKGLEFPVVFVPYFNDGILPSQKALGAMENLEEERRLAYVALTRAEKRLYITESEGATERGTTKLPSRFLFEVNREQLNVPNIIPQSILELLEQQTNIQIPQQNAEEFIIGQIVQHEKFGKGEIVKVDEASYTIDFEKFSTSRTIKKSSGKLSLFINNENSSDVILIEQSFECKR